MDHKAHHAILTGDDGRWNRHIQKAKRLGKTDKDRIHQIYTFPIMQIFQMPASFCTHFLHEDTVQTLERDAVSSLAILKSHKTNIFIGKGKLSKFPSLSEGSQSFVSPY